MPFRLVCRNKFYNNLGQFDAICEFTEVAVRDFVSNNKHDHNFNIYLDEKASQHNIKVNSVKQSFYKNRIAQSYILSVYQAFELYLREFKVEQSNLYNKSWKLSDSSDSLLFKIIDEVSSIEVAKKTIGEFRIGIYEYYRVIRNKYSHEIIKDTKIKKAYNEILKFKTEILLNYPNLNAPNTFNTICFDDFILFSRVVKDIADGLCELITPDSKELFIEYYKRNKKFNKFNKKPIRKRNAIKNDLVSNFGNINDIESILNELAPLA